MIRSRVLGAAWRAMNNCQKGRWVDTGKKSVVGCVDISSLTFPINERSLRRLQFSFSIQTLIRTCFRDVFRTLLLHVPQCANPLCEHFLLDRQPDLLLSFIRRLLKPFRELLDFPPDVCLTSTGDVIAFDLQR